MFMNLAHRGASETAPENTLAAFYKGIDMGANGIETDLKRTKDGVLILHHDDTLKRTTNGVGRPSDYTWEELNLLDAGAWFSPEFTGERLVTFEQFLYYFGRKNLLFAFELKDPGIEEQVLALITRYGVTERTTVTSFHFEYLEEMRKQNKRIKLGYLVMKIDEESLERIGRIGARQVCPKAELLTEDDISLAKGNGLEVRAWGVHGTELMHRMLKLGVDGMTVNFPDRLAETLSGFPK